MWVNWFLLLLDLAALRSRSVIIHYLTSTLLRFNPGLGYWQRKLDTAARYYSLNSMPCDIFFSDLLSFLLTNILPTNMLQKSTTAVPTLMPKYRITIQVNLDILVMDGRASKKMVLYWMIYSINLLSAYNKIKNDTRGYVQNFSFYFTKLLQYLNFFNGN